MAGRHVLRDNLFLIAAAALPLLVVAFFLVATAVPSWLVPPPTHDLLFTATRALYPDPAVDSGTRLEYRVSEDRVVAHARRTRDNGHSIAATLYRYDPDTGSVREIRVDLPGDLPEDRTPRTLAIEALADVRVSTSYRSPDGYILQHDQGNYPGLFGALLGLGRSDGGPFLVKDGRRVPIRPDGEWRRHHRIEFLGWVIDERG